MTMTPYRKAVAWYALKHGVLAAHRWSLMPVSEIRKWLCGNTKS